MRTKKSINYFRLILIPVALMCLLSSTLSFSQQNNWPMFRGPNGSGVSSTTRLPAELAPYKNVIWRVDLPLGFSSPVLTEKYILVTSIENEKLYTICLLRKNGKTVWKKEAPRPRKEKLDNRNNPASPSPVTDGKNVYVFFPDFGMLAYDLKGKELWKAELGPFNNLYGMGASPIHSDDKVILVCDTNTDSYIIALDKSSGKTVWKKERSEAKSGHSTPILYTPADGGTQVIVPGSFQLIAYSVKTGERIWWVNGLSFEMKSTPVINNGLIYINGYASPLNQPGQQVKIPSFEQAIKSFDKDGNKMLSQKELPREQVYGWFSFVDVSGDGNLDASDWKFFKAALASLNGMLAIRLGGKGNMSDKSLVWHYRKSVPQLPSPLVYNDVLYMLNDGGIVTTFNPATGEEIAKGRIKGAGSKFYASPVAADGKVYIISRRGIVSVIKPDGSLDLISQNKLNEEVNATPAIADGHIYLRTNESLYCFGLKK